MVRVKRNREIPIVNSAPFVTLSQQVLLYNIKKFVRDDSGAPRIL